MVRRFELSVYDEMNFLNEGRHAIILTRNAKENRFAYHPRIFREYSTERILTTSLVEGTDLLSILKEKTNCPIDASMNDICARLLWNTLDEVFRTGYFHADLHPANIFVLPRGIIGYVDFGIVGNLSDRLRDSLIYYAMYLFRGELDKSTRELMRWITPSPSTDIEAARHELLRIAEEFYCSLLDQSGDGSQHSFALYQTSVLSVVRRHDMAISPGIVASFRALISVITIIYRINPRFPLRRHANRFFSRLLVDRTCDCLSPHALIRTGFGLHVQLSRTLSALEALGSLEGESQESRNHQRRPRSRVCLYGILAIFTAIAASSLARPDLNVAGRLAGGLTLVEVLWIAAGIFVVLTFCSLWKVGKPKRVSKVEG